MSSGPEGPPRVPAGLRAVLALALGCALAVHGWFALRHGRQFLTWPATSLVAALVLLPFVPYLKKFGVGSVSFVFRRASRDLRDELLRSVERLVPSDSDDHPSVAALRTVESDPDRALSAIASLVYRALYDLLATLEAEGASTAAFPKPSADEPPPSADVRSVLERITAADPPEFDGQADVLDRFLDSLLTARESGEVTAAEARELVELGAHLVTYVRLYMRLYEEADFRG